MPRAQISIRPSDSDDHGQVGNVLTASYSTLLVDSYAPDVLNTVLPFICEPNPDLLTSGNYFVATCEAEGVIGCGGWTMVRPHTGEMETGLGHVRHFAVHPDQLGRGIGRLLFDACLTQARAAGILALESCATINAEGFYQSLGFNAVAREDVLIADLYPFPSVIMTRRIDAGDAV